MTFTGIPAEAFDFYDALAADNTKAFWTDHKGEYEQFVRQPLAGLAAELESEFGTAHLYRPYRDVRFSTDKTPYKDHQGMFVEHRNGLGWYLQVSSQGLMAAGGWYMSTAPQVARFRAAVDADEDGQLDALIRATRKKHFEVDGHQLKTRPRGTPEDHPRLELMRYRTLYALQRWEPAAWMGTRRCVSRVRTTWQDLTPLMEWLSDTVGPGDPPTGSRRGR